MQGQLVGGLSFTCAISCTPADPDSLEVASLQQRSDPGHMLIPNRNACQEDNSGRNTGALRATFQTPDPPRSFHLRFDSSSHFNDIKLSSQLVTHDGLPSPWILELELPPSSSCC